MNIAHMHTRIDTYMHSLSRILTHPIRANLPDFDIVFINSFDRTHLQSGDGVWLEQRYVSSTNFARVSPCCVFVCVCVSVCKREKDCVCVCVHVCMYVCVYIYIYVCMYVCMYMYTIYVHTYMYMYTYTYSHTSCCPCVFCTASTQNS